MSFFEGKITKLNVPGVHAEIYQSEDKQWIFKRYRCRTAIDLEMAIISANILTKLDHPNVIKCYNIEYYNDAMWCKFKFYQYDLRSYFYKNKGESPLPIATRKSILHQLLQAVAYLHSINVHHRDIKWENILIDDSSGEPKVILCDFSHSRHNVKFERSNNTIDPNIVCTITTRAPELCVCNEYTELIDVWSVGVVLLNLINKSWFGGDYDSPGVLFHLIKKLIGIPHESNWNGITHAEYSMPLNSVDVEIKPLFEFITDSNNMRKDVSFDILEFDLIRQMLQYKDKRPTAHTLLSHDYFHQQPHTIYPWIGTDSVSRRTLIDFAHGLITRQDGRSTNSLMIAIFDMFMFNQYEDDPKELELIMMACLRIAQSHNGEIYLKPDEETDLILKISKSLNYTTYIQTPCLYLIKYRHLFPNEIVKKIDLSLRALHYSKTPYDPYEQFNKLVNQITIK
jgi:serine/threonine protein kinase